MTQDLVIDQTLYSSQKSTVYKASQKGRDKPLILKVAETSPDISGLQNEINILKQFYPGKQSAQFIQYNHKPALLREYIPGLSLRQILDRGGHGEPLFKEMAIAIVQRLDELHNNGIIHKDISPGNIIVDLETKEAEIIDFEIGSLTQQVHSSQYFSSGGAGNLHYISPEQTGRMNRAIDYRSDYYSLGIVFYEMLTGRLPFEMNDALELIHCHIAQIPQAVHTVNPTVPKVISAIINKLMAKQSEERYQSLAGLLADLHIYLSGQYAEDGNGFAPGAYDLPFRLKVSQKFMGRERETSLLHSLLQKAASGESCFLEVAGFSGVGKTTLVRESLRQLTQYRGLYISGKFEKVKGSTPFYGWISAFNELTSVLLAETPERQKLFKDSFENTLGNLGGVVTDFCPQLEIFYGQQEPVPALSAKEQQNRFFIAINLLLKSLTLNGFPLILFMDDWQWADEDSINLLTNLVSDKTLKNCLLVTALRDNEVSSVHPYAMAIEGLRQGEGNDLQFISLAPLSEVDCENLIHDTLKKTLKPIQELVAVAFQKTQGNPFFLNAFFDNLYSRKLLFIDAGEQAWNWDTAAIGKLNISDDLAEMVVDKLKMLNEDCYTILQKAAFFGNRFKLKSLASLDSQSMSDVHRTLWPAIQKCLVVPVSSSYKFVPEYYQDQDIDIEFSFVHDRVQQACYNSLKSTDRAQMHFNIGRVLHRQGLTADFDTAVHFMEGLEIAREEFDRDALRELFLQVGHKAFRQSAMETGYIYFNVADSIGPILELVHFKTWLECSSIGGGKEATMKIGERALAGFDGSAQKFEIYETLIRSLETISENKTAVSVSRQALLELGFKLPQKAHPLLVIFHAIQAKMALSDKKIKQLTSFPEISDPKKLALIKILNVSLGPFFLAREDIYPFIIFKMVTLGSKYGNCPEITAGYSSFALSLAGIMNAWESGYLLGVESLKLVEKYQTYKNIAVCGFAFTGFVQHRKDPVKELPERFLHFYKKGMQYGEIIYGNWNLNFAHIYRLLLGQAPLTELEGIFKDIVKFNRQYKNPFDNRDLVTLEFIRSLTGDGSSNFADFASHVELWETNNNPTMNFTWHMYRAIQCWLQGDFEEALNNFEKCWVLEDKMVGSFLAQYYLPLTAVLALRLSRQSGSKAGQYKKIYKSCKKKLRKQHRFYAYNVQWMLDWLKAEEQALKAGKPDLALFERVQTQAREADFHLPAIMVQIHLLKLFKPGDPELAKLVQGLLGQLQSLQMQPLIDFYQSSYKDLLELQVTKDNVTGKKTYTTEVLPDIDLMTVIKATDALTGELNLEKLLHNMLSYIMQNTGASFGCFLVQRNGAFHPEMTLESVSGGELDRTSAEGRVSDQVLRQVVHSRQALILEMALGKVPFSSDEAIVKNGVKSLFCLPFLHQGTITGVVYLTNGLIESVFNDKRVALTKMLAGQIAVSVENAILYEDMEHLVEKRTLQLEKEKQKSDELLLNILPEEVASELKEKGRATARRYDAVTVLFTDFVDFTSHSERLSPEELVNEIDKCYRAFDELLSKYQVEKIKTIGDSYMAVCGLPETDAEHASKILRMALDIKDFMEKYRNQGGIFEVRLGINTGSVIAGIVGSRKFAYDIWGDAVNTASRMEQNSEPGKINISQSTYELVKGDFECEERGSLKVKNKGSMAMYFVNSMKKVASK